uniref:Pr1-like protein n=1 Tax=Oryza sativa subsp. japonica TaxID=39947 RepID=Q6YRP0_ORYSJ|nr:pr1-like protein [Oryza sativa Japonica Group]
MLAFPNVGFNFHEERIFRSCSPGERARGPGPREWGPRGSLTAHGGPGARGLRRSAPWVPRVSRTRGRGRLTAGPTWLTADGRRRARAPMVAAGDQRRGGAAPERGEGRGKRKGRSTAHPGTTRTAETTTGAEEGGGAARVDEDGGVPAVGGRNGGADEVDESAAKPKEAVPKREEVRGDDGGEPELGGDGGERGRRRGLVSDGERKRRVAETEE